MLGQVRKKTRFSWRRDYFSRPRSVHSCFRVADANYVLWSLIPLTVNQSTESRVWQLNEWDRLLVVNRCTTLCCSHFDVDRRARGIKLTLVGIPPIIRIISNRVVPFSRDDGISRITSDRKPKALWVHCTYFLVTAFHAAAWLIATFGHAENIDITRILLMFLLIGFRSGSFCRFRLLLDKHGHKELNGNQIFSHSVHVAISLLLSQR